MSHVCSIRRDVDANILTPWMFLADGGEAPRRTEDEAKAGDGGSSSGKR